MGKNGFTYGNWNGITVEIGKVYTNPMLRAFLPINEIKSNKLRVFDFDDTIATTDSNVYVTHSNGKKSKMTPGEYALYDPKKGDDFDFSEFDKVNQPQEIKGVTKLLKSIVQKGDADVAILTARSKYQPVKDYLKQIGVDSIYVQALGDANPKAKADWIENKIKKGATDVFFIDDSHKNVEAVRALKNKYPNISMRVQHVKSSNIPNTSPDMKNSDTTTTKSDDINKLASLIPKQDLNKTIKNPDTGRTIKVKTALGYDKDSKAYNVAKSTLNNK